MRGVGPLDTAGVALDPAVVDSGVQPVLIGDSVTDVEVSHATGIRAIGYAKSAARGSELIAAEADALTERMSDLVPHLPNVQ
jgi:phosphoglycolate phosphatase